MAVADGAETRMTSGSDYIFAYRISADGERIIISRRPTRLPADSDKMELWNIAADGSTPIRLTKNAVPEEDGELAPDGSHVLFVARANHRQEPYYNANLFLVPAGGGQVRALDAGFSVRSAASGLGRRQQVDLDDREHRRAASICSRSISRRRSRGRSRRATMHWCRRSGARSRGATCS